MRSDDELDELIERITIDAYGDEGYWAFLQAFEDEVRFPINATLVGKPIVVTSIDFDGNERRGLVAAIEQDGTPATVTLLDIEIPTSERTANQLIAAYRRWLGIT